MQRHARATLFVLAVSAGLLTATTARAEEQPELETADGWQGCFDFRERNQRELERWEASQPPVPYRYPREKTFLNAPWAQFFSNLGHSGDLVLATLIPHVGAQYRAEAPAAYIGWPWSILVFGPMYSCSRKNNTFVVHGHRAHRIMLEPAVVSSKLGVGFSVRPGYRFIWHPSQWTVGPGLGLGSTVDIAGNREGFRYSVSPEAVAHFGHCCSPRYFTLAVRYDHYFKGIARDIIGANLGYTFF